MQTNIYSTTVSVSGDYVFLERERERRETNETIKKRRIKEKFVVDLKAPILRPKHNNNSTQPHLSSLSLYFFHKLDTQHHCTIQKRFKLCKFLYQPTSLIDGYNKYLKKEIILILIWCVCNLQANYTNSKLVCFVKDRLN